MIGNYLKNMRKDLLPEIYDFSEEQNKYKHMNPSKLNTRMWFWLHPSCYKLVYFGVPGTGIFNSIISYLIYLWKGWVLLKFVSIVFGIISLILLIRKIWKYKYHKGLTFYDVYLKDETVNDMLTKDLNGGKK